MHISGSVALISGANRGLGLALARELVRRGAAKVYGGAREVLADERSRDVKAKLSRDYELIYPPIQAFWDAAVTGAS
jgi:NAD(P)-dependent dehydrogenase (short-subunit alcohol dehydrogenase family)